MGKLPPPLHDKLMEIITAFEEGRMTREERNHEVKKLFFVAESEGTNGLDRIASDGRVGGLPGAQGD